MNSKWFKPESIKVSETAIKKQIKYYLQYRGWFIFHVLQGVGSYKGVSDFIAIKAGKVLFIEVKTMAGKQSADQLQFEANIKSHGGIYLVARSIEDIKELAG